MFYGWLYDRRGHFLRLSINVAPDFPLCQQTVIQREMNMLRKLRQKEVRTIERCRS